MKFVIALLLCCLISGCAGTAEKKVYGGDCVAIRVPDGSPVGMESAIWNNAPTYSLNPLPGYAFRNPVKIQFAYDREFLYFRFDAADDDLLDETPAEVTSGMFLHSDAMEFFVRPPNSRGYWEFHFTPSGRHGAIHFPSRGRRMPSNVRYLPFPGMKFTAKLSGTLNQMTDRDERWTGLAKIPLKGIAERCAPFDTNSTLLIQVTDIAYSVYADWDEKSQLFYEPGTSPDPHYLPSWRTLRFQK